MRHRLAVETPQRGSNPRRSHAVRR